MKKFMFLLAVVIMAVPGCKTSTPKEEFEVAVLGSNLVFSFASDGELYHLDNPSVKLVEGSTSQTTPMKRTEIIETKVNAVNDNFEKVKSIGINDDNRLMVEASKSLHAYTLAVYKNEYMQLAKLYDENTPEISRKQFADSINQTYHPTFEKLHAALIKAGKAYASKHNINVQWDLKTKSP